MGYLVQKSRAAQLLIGNVDYTSNLVSWEVSDSGAFKQGLMTTTGTLVLGQVPGAAFDVEDYDRTLFKRGTIVTLDMQAPGGSIYRHPRGFLYIIGAVYNVEAEQLEVELGCLLAMAYLTEDESNVIDDVPIPLDPAQQTIENCSASYASAGMVLYQDKNGDLLSRKFFEGDSSSGVASGEWVSVLGKTALSVSPLASAGAIPDKIQLSYNVPLNELATDNSGKVDTVVETSNYFVAYPATVWTRNPNPTPSGQIQLPDTVTPTVEAPPTTTGCGQVPAPPSGSTAPPGESVDYFLCNALWTTDRETVYLPATRVSTSETHYGGPAGQVSMVEQVVQGPEIEANPQYFADVYAFCVTTYGDACKPNGGCSYYGMDTHTLSRQITLYYYGKANELIQTVQETYETILSARPPSDYRAGVVNGVPQFMNTTLSASDGLYRSSRIITEYYQEGNTNVQLTTSYRSITSRGVGELSGASIDAMDGIKTSVKRESTTTTTLDVRPDTVNTATTSTEERTTEIILTTSNYVTPPYEAAGYEIDESIPVPLLSTNSSEVQGWVDDFTEYLTRFVKGDLYGLQIAESMRPEIVLNWYPGMPFRYADTSNNKILAMRMDACTWGVTREEALVVTNGIWLGFSTGTLAVGSNLVGNSRPNMGGGGSPTPPPGPDLPPSVDNDIVGESFEFVVEVDLWLDISTFTYFEGGVVSPNPTDSGVLLEQSIVPYCTGFVVEAGGLLETVGAGSIPVDYNGSIVTSNATIVTANLFS